MQFCHVGQYKLRDNKRVGGLVLESKQVFYNFVQEYIVFLDQMIEAQKTQLEAVLSKQVKQVEKSVASLQTFLMKLDSMEKKRMELQEQAGYDDMTFRQIIETASDSQRQELQTLFEGMEKRVSDIAYYNSKSQEKVKLDLQVWNNSTAKGTPTTNAGGYTANKKHIDSTGKSSVFETKV